MDKDKFKLDKDYHHFTDLEIKNLVEAKENVWADNPLLTEIGANFGGSYDLAKKRGEALRRRITISHALRKPFHFFVGHGKDRYINQIIASVDYMPKNTLVKIGLKLFTVVGYIVYSITCRITNKVFVGICNPDMFFASDYLLINHKLSNSTLGQDLKMYPMGEFVVEIKGMFMYSTEAIIHKDYILNNLLNDGREVYNQEIHLDNWKRFLVLKLPNKTASKIIKFCMKNNIRLTVLFMRLMRKYIIGQPRFRKK